MGRGMYALQGKPTRFVSTARILPQKTLSNLETREIDKPTCTGISSPIIRPVFNSNKVRYQNIQRLNSMSQQPQYSEQHDERVQYLSEAWVKVNSELEKNQKEFRNDKDGVIVGPTVYREKNPNAIIKDFKPFDLDTFLCDRLYRQVTETS